MYRRNPLGLNVGDIKRTLVQGAKDAVAVVAGEVAVSYVETKISAKIPNWADSTGKVSAPKAIALRAALAIGAGIAASKVTKSRDIVRMVVAGALAAPIKAFAKSMVPATQPDLLAAFGGYPLMGGYPTADDDTGTIAAYLTADDDNDLSGGGSMDPFGRSGIMPMGVMG